MKRVPVFGVIVFVAILFFHFRQVPEVFTFDIDTQYQALYAQTILKDFHIIWIGVSAGSTGFYLGPGLVYLTAILLWLSTGDPLILGYFASTVGFFTCISVYYIMKHIYDRRTSLFATILYGFSAFITYYDRKYWPIFVPLIAMWLYYSLVKARKNSRWLILNSILIGTAFHVHLSLFIFIPFIIWQFYSLRKKIDRLTWIYSICAFVGIISPLIVFDLVHNFTNLRTPVRMLSSLGQGPSTGLSGHVSLLVDSVNNIWWWSSHQWAHVVSGLISLCVLVSVIKLKKSYPSRLLLGIIIIFIGLFLLYPGTIQEYYVVLLFPFAALAGALLLNRLPLVLASIIVIVFIVVNTLTSLQYTNPKGLANKKKLITDVTKKLKTDYYLDYETDMDYEGWRYLFAEYGKKPAQSKADSMFGWLYPEEISKTKPPMRVTIPNLFSDVPPRLDPEE